MRLPANLWPKVCEKLVKSSVIPEEKINAYHISQVHSDDTDTVLRISAGEDKYILNLTLSRNLDNSECISIDDYPAIFIEGDNIKIKINHLSIDGYRPCTLEEINDDNDRDANYLKAIFKALAVNHSRSITSSKTVKDSYRYGLVRDDYKKILSILYEVIEKHGGEEVNGALFERNIEKIYYFSGETLRPKMHNVYVESYVLQSKLFFKLSDSGDVKCKMINTAPNKYLPLVYDVLMCLFLFSTPKTRQRHFHELLDFYYNTLTENLGQSGLNISNILPDQKYNKQTHRFSPYAKTEVALFKCYQYLKPLKILDDGSFVTNIWNLFDADNRNLKYIWKWILELNSIVSNSNLSKEDCYKIIKNKIGSTDYEFLSWKLIPLEKRAGYLGDYFKLKISIKQNNEVNSLYFFAKCLPSYNEAMKEIARIAIEKEDFYYATFISQVKHLGFKGITDFLPKCYFSRIYSIIVLDDMSLMNYRSFRQDETFSYETVLLVIKQLAKVHASSLLFEEAMTENLGEPYRIDDKFGKFVEEALLDMDGDRPRPVIACGISGALNYLLDTFPDIPKKFTLKEFKEKLKALYDKLVPLDLKSAKYRNVICHGDIWANNFLFKMDEQDNPTQCCIIDYQLTRYCPPSHDLLFFLYLNMDRSCRKQYMSTIVQVYYTELSRIFENYNFDLSKIYTYEHFLESCDFVKPMAVALASLYMQVSSYPPEKIEILLSEPEKFDYVISIDRKEVLDEVHCNSNYRQRIKDILEDLCEVCECI